MRQVPASQFRLISPYFIVIVLDIMSLWLLLPLLAPLVHQASGNMLGAHRHWMYGIILSIPAFCQIIAAPLLGMASDYLGRKKVLLYCCISAFISFIIYSASFSKHSLILLIVARILNGFSSGSVAVAQSVMADISEGKQRAINIALIAVAMTLGLIIGPLLGGVLSDSKLFHGFNNATPFHVATVLSFLGVIIVYQYLIETFPQQQQQNKLEAIKQLITSPYILCILSAFFLFELAWSLYFQFIPLFMSSTFKYSNSLLAIFLNYITIVMSIGLLLILRVTMKAFSLQRVVLIGLLVNALTYLIIYLFSERLAIQWLMALPVALAVATSYPGLKGLASHFFPQQGQGLLMGTAYGLLCAAFGISALLTGYLSRHSFSLPFMIAFISCLIAAIIFIIGNRLASSSSSNEITGMSL